MTVSLFSRMTAGCGLLTLALPVLVLGQANYAPHGGEYAVAGGVLGDQVCVDAAVRTAGGFVVWQDGYADGEGLGISALRLDSSLSGMFSPFRVNQRGADDQERPRVSLLHNGGAVFVWQGGRQGFQRIYARFLSANATWTTEEDVLVNTFTNQSQLNPAVATLSDDQAVVVWASFDQRASDSLQDVYFQRLSAAGQKLGGETPVNQTAAFNQRTPVVAALADGRFVIVWVSEQQRFENSVDVYARLFNANGGPASGEFLVNTGTNICANPSVAAAADGGFLVAWGERDLVTRSNGWDIVARPFSSAGVGGSVRRVNTHAYGDQFAPRVSCAGTDYLVVWTSLGQDGSREGVYGRLLASNGSSQAAEFRVNTTTANRQIQPAVASDGAARFLVTWSGYAGAPNNFDLFAQRYATAQQPLPPLDPPFVTVLSSSTLSVTWPVLAGFDVAGYEVYADGAASPTAVVTNNWWTMENLATASTHNFRLAYVLGDGRRSPLSGASSATTYGSLTYGGVPYDWMTQHWGSDVFLWPSPYVDSDGDGATNLDEFLAGTNPRDEASVLKQRLQRTPQGMFLVWNTRPGLIYQVEVSTNLGAWQGAGGPRFAAGTVDSMFIGGADRSYYRIVRLR
jgi:hypothetical protein